MSDIELTVGVDVEGSYGEFKSDIESLVNKVNSNPPKVKVDLDIDKRSERDLKRKLDDATKRKRKASSDDVKIENQRLTRIAKANREELKLQKELEKYTAAKVGKSKLSYDGFQKDVKSFQDLNTKLREGTILVKDYDEAYKKLDASMTRHILNMGKNNELKKSLEDQTKDMQSKKADALSYKRTETITKAYKTLGSAYNNLDKWTAAKNGKSSSHYNRYEKDIHSIEELTKRLRFGEITVEEFNNGFKKIQSTMAISEAAMRKAGEATKDLTSKLSENEQKRISALEKTRDSKIAKANREELNLQKELEKYTAAKVGKSKKAYNGFDSDVQEFHRLNEQLRDGSILVSDYNNQYNKLMASMSKHRLDMGKNDELKKAANEDLENEKSILKKQELLNKGYNLSKRGRTNLGKWSLAERGKSKNDYLAYKNSIDALDKLNESFNENKISASEFKKQYKEIQSTMLKSSIAIQKNGENTKSLKDRLGGLAQKFASWFTVSQVLMHAVSAAKQMVNASIELDTSMTELKKVTDETDETYERFLDNAANRSKKLGSSLTDTINATADFARLGYNIKDAEKLADAATVYKNVGDGIENIDEASSSIISTMQAFGIEANDAMSIVDKFNEIGNNYAISSDGVGQALIRSAAAMKAANNTLDETIALATAANTVIQDPEKVGTTLKTVSMYLRASKTDAEAAGESTDGMADSVSKLREEVLQLTGNKVDIQLDDKTFKSTYQILKELSGVWGELSDISQANLLERLGGKRNSNVVSALLENFSVAEKALETSSNSEGSALVENEKQLESIQGRLNITKASFQNFSKDLVNSDIVKFFVNSATAALDFADAVVKVTNLVGGLGTVLGTVALSKFFSGLGKNKQIDNGTSLFSEKIISEFTNNADNFKDLDIKNLSKGFSNVNKSVIDMAKGVQDGSVSIEAFSEKTTKVSKEASKFKITTDTLKNGLKSVGTIAKNIGVAFLISEGIYLTLKAIDEYNHQYSRAVENAANASSEYQEQKNYVKQLTSEYDTLQDKIKQLKSLQADGSITLAQEVELANLQNQSAELERQLDIQKQILEAKAKASADSAKIASEKEMSFVEMNQEKYGKVKGYLMSLVGLFDTGFGDNVTSEYDKWKQKDTTQSGLIKEYLSDLKDYESELNDVQEDLRKDANNPEYLKREKELNEKIINTKEQLSSGIGTIQKWIDQSLGENGLPIKGSEKFVDNLRDIVTEYQNLGKSAKEIGLNNLNNYFSSTSGSSMRKYLEDIVRNGGSAEDALKAFRESGMRLKDIDVSQSVFLRYFEDIKKSAKEAEKAIISVDGTFSGVNTAFESENKGAGYDKMIEYFKKSKELNQSGLWGTDDFQTIAQFGVGYDIAQKLKDNADAYTYASDAYVEAYNKALPLLERWYGNEDESVNMNNVLTDFTNNGLARNLGNGEYSFKDENGAMMFKNTAQAAEALGTSIENIELVMSKLQEHGFEFDGVERSAEQLSRYKTSLEGIHALVEDMKDGSQKERIMKLLPSWDEELEKFKDPNYLATLTEDQILKIEFEYDLAQLQQQLNEAMELAQATGDNKDWASARLAAKNIREHYEGQTGYNENSGDSGYSASYAKIDELSASMKGQSEEVRAEINESITSLMQLQNAFQDFRLGGGQLNWTEFINSDSASEALNNILETTNLTKEQLADLLNVDVKDLHLDVDADTSKAEEKLKTVDAFEFANKVAELTMNDNATPYLKIWNELQANDKFTTLSATDQASYVVELWNSLTPEQKEAYMKGEITVSDEATGTVQAVEGELNKLPLNPKAVISAKNNTGTAVLNARTALNNINGKTAHTYIVTHYSTSGKKSKLNGTAHVDGSVGGLYPIPKLSHRALALGTLQDTSWLKPRWRTKEDEVALTGELGTEIVVHGNRWWTIGDNGAEFSSIPKGSVVFNHKQSKELLTKGFTNSRAKSYAHGTAFASGGRLPSSTVGVVSNKNTSSGSSGSSPSKSAASATQATKDALDAITDYFDWIKVRYDRLARETELSEKTIDTAIGLIDKQSKTADTIQKVQAEINAAQQGANRYLSHANWFANSSGLSGDIISRIQNGTIDINKYDEDTKKKIDEYKSWYDEYINSLDKITELQEKELELAKRRLSNIEDFYKLVINVSESLQGANDALLEFEEAKGFSNISDAVRKVYEQSMNEAQNVYNNSVEQLSAYQAEFNELVSKGYIKKDSDAWYEAQAKINELTEAVHNAGTSIVEFEDKIRNIEYTKIQNIIDGFERAVSKLEAYASLLESRDQVVPESLYQKQLDSNNSKIKANYDLRNAKLREQAFYDVNSKRYQELAEEINKIDTETLGLMADNEKLKDSIFELRFTPLDEALDKYERLSDEISKFMGLLNEKAFFDKNGNGTIELATHIAMIQQQMGLAKQKIADYRTGLNKLQESLNNGVISQKEYNEKSEEYRNGLQDAVIDVKKFQDSLTDLYMTQLKNEVDATEKVIDKWAEARNQQEKYWDYSKKLKGQQKSVDMLKAQIQALDGVTNASAIAEKKRLEAELAREQEALDETKRDHRNEMMDLGDSKTKEALQNMLEETEYNIAHSAEKQESVINLMLDRVLGKYKDVFGQINSIIGNTGWIGSSDFNTTQGQLGTSGGAQSQNNAASQSATNTNSSNTASGVITNPIKDNASANKDIENEIMKEPNTTNRKVAEVKLSKSSVSMQEGQATTITAAIRPTDAKNKTLSWTSSNGSVASVANGTIRGLKPGKCTVTATTTDGSGLSATVSVTVTKKPDPPKPPKPPANNTSNGDGVARVGDKVTLKAGQSYYYDSWGVSPAGNRYAGVKNGVVIDGYSAAKYGGGAKYTGGYDVHIKSADGRFGDLGWVRLDQLEGYAKGTGYRGVSRDQYAWTQERGQEMIYRKVDGALLTKLGKGDVVFNNKVTKNLMDWGKINPVDIMSQNIKNAFPTRGLGITVEQNIGNLLTVEGNVDRDALPELKELLKQSCDYTVKHINSELKKNGFRR